MMKRIKDRPMYPALEARIKTQEERIKTIGLIACFSRYVATERGTLYSTKFKTL